MRFASRSDISALFEPSPKIASNIAKKMANLAKMTNFEFRRFTIFLNCWIMDATFKLQFGERCFYRKVLGKK